MIEPDAVAVANVRFSVMDTGHSFPRLRRRANSQTAGGIVDVIGDQPLVGGCGVIRQAAVAVGGPRTPASSSVEVCVSKKP